MAKVSVSYFVLTFGSYTFVRKKHLDHLQEYCQQIKRKATALGFQACGISKATFLQDEKKGLEKWLQKGMHGEMVYLERNMAKRTDPRLLVENARSVITVLMNYFPKEIQKDPHAPVLSKYAYGTDYHFIVKSRLKELLTYIHTELLPVHGRAFVDSAPVMERTWAQRAGLGWIGKNGLLISPEHGSFLFIGELIVDAVLAYDTPFEKERCGSCNKCLDACPTRAIVAPRILDARKCISYQTIEKRGEIDQAIKGSFHNRVFGCDICQDICPWNRKAIPHNEPAFHPHPQLMDMDKKEWYEMDSTLYNKLFKNSAVKRIGYKGITRNLNFIGMDGKQKKYRYITRLFEGDRGGVYADFPYDCLKEFGTKGHVKVNALIDGYPYRGSLMPEGDGTHTLIIRKMIREAIRKKSGDEVIMEIERDLKPREVTVPEDLQWLLDDEVKLKLIFEGLSYAHRKFFVDHINEAKSPDTRARRIEKVLDMLRERLR